MDDRKIEEYRQPWESEDHWKLRKEFILKYKDQFPEYTLIALSQVHSDTELHGKRFPVPVILPSSQECEEITDKNDEMASELFKEKKQGDPKPCAEEKKEQHSEEQDAGLLSVAEEEDHEMFVEVIDEDQDDPEMSFETGSRNDPETLHGQSIHQGRRSDLPEGVVKLPSETVQDPSQTTERNRDSAHSESSHGEKDIQFDTVSESSNDESELSSSQANLQQSDSSLESSGELPESLKENLVNVFQFVRKLRAEKVSDPLILDKLAKEFNVKVEYLSEEIRKAKCVHMCSVVVDGVCICMGRAPTKKSARRQAVNLTVSRLMNINWLLVKANFSFSKLSEIVCATKQCSSQESGGVSVEGISTQGIEFNPVPEKSENETGLDSLRDITQISQSNLFEGSFGQNELNYEFCGSLQAGTGQSCVMPGSYALSEDSISSEKVVQGMLPRSFKDNFMDVIQFIKKQHEEKLNGLQILEKLSKTFNANVEFNSAVFTHAKTVHHCTVEIDGVLISRGKGSTKKHARRDAGKLAVDRLTQLLTRAKLSFNYRSKLSVDTNSLDMPGDVNVMYENYPCQSNDGNDKTRHFSSESTMQSSRSSHSANCNDLDALPTYLRAKFKQVSQFVRKSVAQKVNPVSILNNMSQKFKLPVKFKVKEHHFLSHECFLFIDSKMFAKAEALSEREARSSAATLAVERLMEISDRVRNVNSGKDGVVGTNLDGDRKNGWFVCGDGTGVTSRDNSVLYPANNNDSVVNAFKNSSWLLNVLKYSCAASSLAARNDGLASLSQSGFLRQSANSMNISDERNQNVNRKSGNENLSGFMVDYTCQSSLVRSTYPALPSESGYARPDLLSNAERSNVPQRVDRYNLSDRGGQFDQSLKEGRFDLANNRAERFGLPNNTMERFDLPINRTERFDLPVNRTERFDLPNNQTERFDLPNNQTERFDLPVNRMERFDLPNNRTERFDVPNNRMERFDLPNNRTDRFDLPDRTERFSLPNRTERFDLANRAEGFNLPNRTEGFNLPNRTEGFNLPNRTERFDLPNRTERFNLSNNRTETFVLPNNRTERFDLPNRTERFDLPSRTERSDLPSRTERSDLPSRTERSDLPSRTERSDLLSRTDRSDLPNRLERFDLPSRTDWSDLPNRSERFDLPVRSERRHLSAPYSSRQNRVKDDGLKVWLHQL